ncbi:MAG: hypothetical protein K2Q22_14650, partial [Cytophagales bacterium]|nr:hypothetical protein [Cytophagales bacterium]
MKRLYPILCIVTCFLSLKISAQSLPSGGQWGCPAIPIQSTFDNTCFQATSEIKLGQGFFDHYGS